MTESSISRTDAGPVQVPQTMDVDIASMELPELRALVLDEGLPAFRAGQLFGWIHRRQAVSYDEMSDLPKDMRERFSAEHPLHSLTAVRRQVSADGTRKYLFRLYDGNLVESVLMRYRYGDSVCISSQVGCRMGCRFCASTLDGLTRGLYASEMLGQVYAIAREEGVRVSHVVVMGTGEPLDNYGQLLRFIRLISDEKGMHLSRRALTVSTCGIVPRMLDLAREDLPITLALSLHAPTDEKRRRIMPIAEKYSIEELMQACEQYFAATGRRITFEYSLIAGENDSAVDAAQLAALASRVHAHVNLIPVNPVRERGYAHPDADAVQAFKNRLEKSGINVSIRRVLGRDIDGACGQLRHRQLAEESRL